MLIVKFNGGLGNQMFQYVFLEFLRKNNIDVKADCTAFNKLAYHHGYELGKVFGISMTQAKQKEINKLVADKNSILSKFCRKFLHLFLIKQTEFQDRNDIACVRDGVIKEDIYFAGFWQDHWYLDQLDEQLIRNAFRFAEPISGEKNLILAKKIGEIKTCAIHVRRGDYVGNALYENICNKEYYQQAITIMIEKRSHIKFIVFSDDVEWCRKNLPYLEDADFVDWNQGSDSYNDLRLMSMCSHNIIANSSFSWWGAWLNGNPEKVVICPEKWDNSYAVNYLKYSSWIAI